jgi:glycine hydroxymethyltransferase
MSHPTFRIAIGADHGAFDLKNAVVAHLKAVGHEVHDFGTHTTGAVDYADYANLVARNVADGTYDFGILACTSGVGMSIAANRHRHVRAASVRTVEEAAVIRMHNDANILCLSGKYTDAATAIAMTDAFLATAFEGGRHEPRICKSSGSRIAQTDPAIYEAITAEEKRQRNNIELIASENFASPAVMEAQGSVLTNKYAEGYPGRAGMAAAKTSMSSSNSPSTAPRSFSAPSTPTSSRTPAPRRTPRCISPCSSPATRSSPWTSPTAATSPTATRRISPADSTTSPTTASLRRTNASLRRTGKNRPRAETRLITVGASAYSRVIDFERMGKLAREVGAYLFVDMAHIAGLVAAGVHPSPIPHADFVTSTTHKSLRGPRGGIILCKEEFAKKIDAQVFPGIQGGPLMHVIAAKAVCFGEALKPEFKEYSAQVVRNAQAIAARLTHHGFRICSGGTDNHVMLVDLRNKNLNGTDASHALDEAGITVNKNGIPFDTGSPMKPSGIRIGTPAVTTRGMKEGRRASRRLHPRSLSDHTNTAKLHAIRERVFAFNRAFPLPW